MSGTNVPVAKGEILIYEKADSSVQIEVRSDGDTVWLNRNQLAELFDRDVKTIGKHINNALKEELENIPVVANFATTASDGKTYQVEHYNLEMVLSLGYRVKSNQGVQFRIWANSVLKEYVIKGYVQNNKRMKEIGIALDILNRSDDELVSGIAEVLNTFADGLDLLDDYDHQRLAKPKGNTNDWILGYDEARAFVDSMKFGKESDLFGNEKDESFHGSLGAIYQTFEGKELYPSVQEKAANLLYMIVKNHSFTDGNKRIAAALFIYFLDKNSALTGKTGNPIISGNTLAAITLMIALSKPDEKEIMCALVMNMLDAGENG